MVRVAFIVDDLFEDSELRVPLDRVRAAGHEPILVGVQAGKHVHGFKGKEIVTIDRSIHDVSAADFDALVIPGGYSPDRLRVNDRMVELVREMVAANKPVAAVCHGPWMLVEADVLEGRTITSWPSIKTDVLNAGASWIDRDVVEDGNLITSRKPDDLGAFTTALLHQIETGAPEHAAVAQPSRSRRRAVG
jgi:protease I